MELGIDYFYCCCFIYIVVVIVRFGNVSFVVLCSWMYSYVRGYGIIGYFCQMVCVGQDGFFKVCQLLSYQLVFVVFLRIILFCVFFFFVFFCFYFFFCKLLGFIKVIVIEQQVCGVLLICGNQSFYLVVFFFDCWLFFCIRSSFMFFLCLCDFSCEDYVFDMLIFQSVDFICIIVYVFDFLCFFLE